MTIFALLSRLFLFEYDRLKTFCTQYLTDYEAGDTAAYALSQLFLAGLNRNKPVHGPYYELYRIAVKRIEALYRVQGMHVPVTWRRTVPLPTRTESDQFLSAYSLLAFVQARHPMGVRERLHLATAISSYMPEMHTEDYLRMFLALDPASSGILDLVRSQVGSWHVHNVLRLEVCASIALDQGWRHNEWVENQTFIRKEQADGHSKQDQDLGHSAGQEGKRGSDHGGQVGSPQPVRHEHQPAGLDSHRGHLA
jgi:hypothetical protein